MTTLLGFRLVKLLGVCLFAAGCIGGGLATTRRDRAVFAYGAGTVGWLACWITGYGLMKLGGHEMSDPWVTTSMAWSFLALLGAVMSAQGPRNPLWAGLSVAGLCGSVAVMGIHVFESVQLVGVACAVVGGAGAAAWVLWTQTPEDAPTGSEGLDAVHTWFDWLSRLEGLSLLALFGVYMPAKYGMGVELDGGQGWFGWVHGMLFVLYLVALVVVTRTAGWSLSRAAAGFVAALLPFGTFVFEARSRRWRT
jgi:integral membrane protein